MKLSVLAAILSSSWFGSYSISFASESSELIEQAHQCRQIPTRLERLACFDKTFETPFEDTLISVADNFYPPEWTRATDARNSLNFDDGWALVTEGEGEEGDAWIVLPAQNVMFSDREAPVLLLSCINNLSRVELALPEEKADARIQVSIRGITQYWRSDDYGVLFSSARGLSAIDMMKRMANESSLTLRSNADFSDGLHFSTRGLEHGLQALRVRCGW